MFQINVMNRVEINHFRTRRRTFCQLSLRNASMPMFISFIILCLFSNITQISAVHDEKSAMFHLSRRHGYRSPGLMNSHPSRRMSEEDLSIKAITESPAASAGLNMTGKLNITTSKMMSQLRCGVRDEVGVAGHSRRKRSLLSRWIEWETNNLSYKISKYTEQLSQSVINYEFERAFNVWSQVTPLKFRRVTHGEVHIDIRFEKYKHGRCRPFEGPWNQAAHVTDSVDGTNLEVHFDDSESWTMNSTSGTSALFRVAVHEFGHVLGLPHSDVRDSIMYPATDTEYNGKPLLHSDDIEQIQALHGPRPKHTDTASYGPNTDITYKYSYYPWFYRPIMQSVYA